MELSVHILDLGLSRLGFEHLTSTYIENGVTNCATAAVLAYLSAEIKAPDDLNGKIQLSIICISGVQFNDDLMCSKMSAF